MALNIEHPDFLLDKLTYRQIIEWMAYDRINPIDNFKTEFGLAQICSVVFNIANSLYSKNRNKMTNPSDFMPNWSGNKEKNSNKKQTVEEMKAILFGIAGKKLK